MVVCILPVVFFWAAKNLVPPCAGAGWVPLCRGWWVPLVSGPCAATALLGWAWSEVFPRIPMYPTVSTIPTILTIPAIPTMPACPPPTRNGPFLLGPLLSKTTFHLVPTLCQTLCQPCAKLGDHLGIWSRPTTNFLLAPSAPIHYHLPLPYLLIFSINGCLYTGCIYIKYVCPSHIFIDILYQRTLK